MLVDPVDQIQGLLQSYGWNRYEIDEKGTKALEDQRIPKDVEESINKAVLGLTKVYRLCQVTFQARLAVCR